MIRSHTEKGRTLGPLGIGSLLDRLKGSVIPSSSRAGAASDTRVDEVAASVEGFIRTRSRVSADDSRFSRQCNLWEESYVDSIGVVELIGYVETTFDVVIPDEALFDPEFTSVNGIAKIVSALRARRSA